MTGYEEELVALMGAHALNFIPESEDINYKITPHEDFKDVGNSEWSILFSNLRRELKAIPEEHALEYIEVLKQRVEIIHQWRQFVRGMILLRRHFQQSGILLQSESFNFGIEFTRKFFEYEDGMEFDVFCKHESLEEEIKAQTGKAIGQLLSDSRTKLPCQNLLKALHTVCFGKTRKWMMFFDSNILQKNAEDRQTVMGKIEKSYEGDVSVFCDDTLMKIFTNFYLSEVGQLDEVLQKYIVTLERVADDIIDKRNQGSKLSDTLDQAEEIHALRRVVSDRDEKIRALEQLVFELSERLSALEQRRGYEDEEKQEDPDRKQVVSDRDEQIDALKQVVFELSERLSALEQRLSDNEKQSTAFEPRFFN